jgi:hypothetical protein
MVEVMKPIVDEGGLADELDEAMHVTFPPLRTPIKGDERLARIVADVTTDTGRTSRLMGEQMQKVLANLERDLKDATEVKVLLEERIADIQSSLAAVKASLEVLGRIDRRQQQD